MPPKMQNPGRARLGAIVKFSHAEQLSTTASIRQTEQKNKLDEIEHTLRASAIIRRALADCEARHE